MDEDKMVSTDAPASPEASAVVASLDAAESKSHPEPIADIPSPAVPQADTSPSEEAASIREAISPAPPLAHAAATERDAVSQAASVVTKGDGSSDGGAPASASAGRRVYQAGTMRKTLLSFVFLLLVPFFASLPAMVYQRVTHQLWTDMLGFAIFAAAFAFIMLLVVFELLHSLRSRVEIGESAVRLILPAARGIAMPKFFYHKKEIPYSEIDLIETRREIYGGTLAPVMLRGARIVTKTGDKVPLGYVSEANVDPVLPVQEIASEIARRTGIEVTDRGTVRREVHKKLRGIKASADAAAAIAESEIASLNRRHNNLMLALCSVLFLLVAGGLLLDISRSNLDLGERAHQLVQQSAKASPQAKKQ